MVLEKERANIIKTTTPFFLLNMVNKSREIPAEKNSREIIYASASYSDVRRCCIASRSGLYFFSEIASIIV